MLTRANQRRLIAPHFSRVLSRKHQRTVPLSPHLVSGNTLDACTHALNFPARYSRARGEPYGYCSLPFSATDGSPGSPSCSAVYATQFITNHCTPMAQCSTILSLPPPTLPLPAISVAKPPEQPASQQPVHRNCRAFCQCRSVCFCPPCSVCRETDMETRATLLASGHLGKYRLTMTSLNVVDRVCGARIHPRGKIKDGELIQEGRAGGRGNPHSIYVRWIETCQLT